jgi:hypothetical protein
MEGKGGEEASLLWLFCLIWTPTIDGDVSFSFDVDSRESEEYDSEEYLYNT